MENKIYWKQKLSSRKFWALIIALVISICALFGIAQDVTDKIICVITAIASTMAYMFAEGLADSSPTTLISSKE